jgi:hypothetical protein
LAHHHEPSVKTQSARLLDRGSRGRTASQDNKGLIRLCRLVAGRAFLLHRTSKIDSDLVTRDLQKVGSKRFKSGWLQQRAIRCRKTALMPRTNQARVAQEVLLHADKSDQTRATGRQRSATTGLSCLRLRPSACRRVEDQRYEQLPGSRFQHDLNATIILIAKGLVHCGSSLCHSIAWLNLGVLGRHIARGKNVGQKENLFIA